MTLLRRLGCCIALVLALSGCVPDNRGSDVDETEALSAASSGRFDIAEARYQEVIASCERQCGPRYSAFRLPRLLVGLGRVYTLQGRDDSAEPLFRRAVSIQEDDWHHRYSLQAGAPDDALDELAQLETRRGRYDEAEQAYLTMAKRTDARRDQLGSETSELPPNFTLGIQFMSPVCAGMRDPYENLAAVYEIAGRAGEAEKTYKQSVARAQKMPLECDRGAALIRSQTNLALYYQHTGRLDEAEPLLRHALSLSESRSVDLDALSARFAYALLLAAQNRVDEAVATLSSTVAAVSSLAREARDLSESSLDTVHRAILQQQAELFRGNQNPRMQRQLFATRSGVQSAALTFAARGDSRSAAELAAELVSEWKGAFDIEQVYWLAAHSPDPEIRGMAKDTIRSNAYNDAIWSNADTIKISERLMTAIRERRSARGWTPDAIRDALPEGAALVEFRQYWPIDFAQAKFDEPHIAVLLIQRDSEIRVKDAGRLTDIERLARAFSGTTRAAAADEAAGELYGALFGPVEDRIRGAKTLYVVPDGVLYLVPFERLRTGDQRYLVERHSIRMLATGRDLLQPEEPLVGKGLIAMGGIDFDGPPMIVAGAESRSSDTAKETEAANTLTRKALGQFKPLPETRQEVDDIAALYRSKRNEPVEVWTGAEAREGRLKLLASPPRVLHLATHGFFLGRINPVAEYEKTLAGVAFAGANLGLAGTNNPNVDGILYDTEALTLNLGGTELVVLSACETGRGLLNYYQGLNGLVSAFRAAGAKYVLVTLWPVGDQQARHFITRFYENWLKQPASDPVAALRQTKLDYISDVDTAQRLASNWSPFVLVGP